MKRITVTLVLLAALVIPYTASFAFMLEESGPSFSPDGETIVFNSNWRGICVMSSSCENKRPINDNAIDFGTCNPTYSPDGEKITFSSKLEVSDNRGDIYVMDKDGSNLKRLTYFIPDNEAPGSNTALPRKMPFFFPDSSKIIFAHTEADNSYSWIYTIKADGTDLQRLSDDDAYDIDPAISLDGKKIVYTSHRSNKTWGHISCGHDFKCSDGDVYIMNIDGSAKKRLTDGKSHCLYPSISPDGKTIVYTSKSNVAQDTTDIYIMDLITRKVKLISDIQGIVFPPIYMPDGDKILYQDFSKGCIIEVISKGNKTILDYYMGSDYSPSPDGSKIAFSSGGEGESVIGVINTDGSGYIQSSFDY